MIKEKGKDLAVTGIRNLATNKVIAKEGKHSMEMYVGPDFKGSMDVSPQDNNDTKTVNPKPKTAPVYAAKSKPTQMSSNVPDLVTKFGNQHLTNTSKPIVPEKLPISRREIEKTTSISNKDNDKSTPPVTKHNSTNNQNTKDQNIDTKQTKSSSSKGGDEQLLDTKQDQTIPMWGSKCPHHTDTCTHLDMTITPRKGGGRCRCCNRDIVFTTGKLCECCLAGMTDSVKGDNFKTSKGTIAKETSSHVRPQYKVKLTKTSNWSKKTDSSTNASPAVDDTKKSSKKKPQLFDLTDGIATTSSESLEASSEEETETQLPPVISSKKQFMKLHKLEKQQNVKLQEKCLKFKRSHRNLVQQINKTLTDTQTMKKEEQDRIANFEDIIKGVNTDNKQLRKGQSETQKLIQQLIDKTDKDNDKMEKYVSSTNKVLDTHREQMEKAKEIQKKNLNEQKSDENNHKKATLSYQKTCEEAFEKLAQKLESQSENHQRQFTKIVAQMEDARQASLKGTTETPRSAATAKSTTDNCWHCGWPRHFGPCAICNICKNYNTLNHQCTRCMLCKNVMIYGQNHICPNIPDLSHDNKPSGNPNNQTPSSSTSGGNFNTPGNEGTRNTPSANNNNNNPNNQPNSHINNNNNNNSSGNNNSNRPQSNNNQPGIYVPGNQGENSHDGRNMLYPRPGINYNTPNSKLSIGGTVVRTDGRVCNLTTEDEDMLESGLTLGDILYDQPQNDNNGDAREDLRWINLQNSEWYYCQDIPEKYVYDFSFEGQVARAGREHVPDFMFISDNPTVTEHETYMLELPRKISLWRRLGGTSEGLVEAMRNKLGPITQEATLHCRGLTEHLKVVSRLGQTSTAEKRRTRKKDLDIIRVRKSELRTTFLTSFRNKLLACKRAKCSLDKFDIGDKLIRSCGISNIEYAILCTKFPNKNYRDVYAHLTSIFEENPNQHPKEQLQFTYEGDDKNARNNSTRDASNYSDKDKSSNRFNSRYDSQRFRSRSFDRQRGRSPFVPHKPSYDDKPSQDGGRGDGKTPYKPPYERRHGNDTKDKPERERSRDYSGNYRNNDRRNLSRGSINNIANDDRFDEPVTTNGTVYSIEIGSEHGTPKNRSLAKICHKCKGVNTCDKFCTKFNSNGQFRGNSSDRRKYDDKVNKRPYVKVFDIKGNRVGERKDRSTIICWNCDKQGHFANQCSEPKRSKSPGTTLNDKARGSLDEKKAST